MLSLIKKALKRNRKGLIFLKKSIKKTLNLLPIKNSIVFESAPDYSDNTRAFYDHLIQSEKYNEYKLIWLIDSSSNQSSQFHSDTITIPFQPNSVFERLKYTYYLSTAKYIISCNKTVHKLNDKTTSINLWHGSGMKSCKGMKLVPDDCDFLITSSEKFRKIFEAEFEFPYEKILSLGYPRNDWLFENVKVLKSLDIGLDYKKYVMWMPTFRQHKLGQRKDTLNDYPLGLPIIKNLSMLNKLNDELINLNIFLMIKLHPAQDLSYIKIENLSNIRLLTNDDFTKRNILLYHLVAESDALITDYSSIYVDYMLLNRPLAFTIDDFDDYRDVKGFVVDDPLKYMPGHHISEYTDFSLFLNDLNNNVDRYQTFRHEVNLDFNRMDYKNACNRIVSYFNI